MQQPPHLSLQFTDEQKFFSRIRNLIHFIACAKMRWNQKATGPLDPYTVDYAALIPNVSASVFEYVFNTESVTTGYETKTKNWFVLLIIFVFEVFFPGFEVWICDWECCLRNEACVHNYRNLHPFVVFSYYYVYRHFLKIATGCFDFQKS